MKVTETTDDLLRKAGIIYQHADDNLSMIGSVLLDLILAIQNFDERLIELKNEIANIGRTR